MRAGRIQLRLAPVWPGCCQHQEEVLFWKKIGGVILEENQGYVIRRTILFDNQCGFALGENSRAPNPYVTWRFNEQDGQRNYFWGHYMNEPDMAERDLLNRAEDYQRRYHVQEVEQAPDKETYLYYSTQRPIDIGTYPNSYFNRPVHMDLYFTRQQVTGEAFGSHHLCPSPDGTGNAGL